MLFNRGVMIFQLVTHKALDIIMVQEVESPLIYILIPSKYLIIIVLIL